MPIIYICLLFLLLVALIYPYRTFLVGTLKLFSSEFTFDSTTLTSIYKGPVHPIPEIPYLPPLPSSPSDGTLPVLTPTSSATESVPGSSDEPSLSEPDESSLSTDPFDESSVSEPTSEVTSDETDETASAETDETTSETTDEVSSDPVEISESEPPFDPDPGLTFPSISISEIEVPNYNTHYGQITCERLGIDCPLYFGDSKAAMKKGVGQYMGSYLPGFNGTILVAGHNTTYFKPLQNIQLGDLFVVYTNYATFVYQVYDYKILDHNDESAFSLKERNFEQLVLYTCWPFERMAGVKTDRLFVYCRKVAGPTVDMGA